MFRIWLSHHDLIPPRDRIFAIRKERAGMAAAIPHGKLPAGIPKACRIHGDGAGLRDHESNRILLDAKEAVNPDLRELSSDATIPAAPFHTADATANRGCILRSGRLLPSVQVPFTNTSCRIAGRPRILPLIREMSIWTPTRPISRGF